MLTTEMEQELLDRARAAGAKGWIIKPFKPALLIGMVTKFMGPA
jgi:two-component system chemotaxis response regulator CheY